MKIPDSLKVIVRDNFAKFAPKSTVGKFVLSIVVFVGVLSFVVFAGGGAVVDEFCIEGRLSQVQADSVNSNVWENCPGYRNGKCVAEVGDRVLTKECSEFVDMLFIGD